MIDFNIPFGPALNRLYKIGNRMMYKTGEAKAWEAECHALIYVQLGKWDAIQGEAMLYVDIYPKDNRVRDIDGHLKALMDMLETNRLVENDRQIGELHMKRHKATGKPSSLRIRLGEATQRQ